MRNYLIKSKNYIFYKNPLGEDFISYEFEPIRQIMRLLVAKDLGIEEKYNWRQYPFYDNIKKTIEKFAQNRGTL